MRVYLVRHGKASKDPRYHHDAERPLTARGRSDVEAIARFLAGAGVQVAQIRHSGLVRAAQTAEILGEHLQPPQGVIAVRGLHYSDPVETLAEELAYESEPVMLVGHNPFMERLTALMLRADGSVPVWFATSSTVCIERVEGFWTLKWALHRELFG